VQNTNQVNNIHHGGPQLKTTTTNRSRNLIWTVLLLGLPSLSLFAQTDSTATTESESDLAKELANPNTTRGQLSFPIDYTLYNGDLPDASSQNGMTINFQPSLPIPLSEGVNLFVRPLIPIFITQPALGPDGFEQQGFNLGNISADVAFGKTWPSKIITLVGVFGSFPTATADILRSQEVTLGPEVMVAKIWDWGVLGLLVNQAWGLGKTNSTDLIKNASITGGQYFYIINLQKGWQISGQPTWSFNHRAGEGNKLTLPFGTGPTKVTHFGKLPVKLALQYWYYIAAPDNFGPQHQIRFTITPVVPLPW
jgi:hypothetical protein